MTEKQDTARKQKIADLIGVDFPDGHTDRPETGHEFAGVIVETHAGKMLSVHYAGNWAGLYLGHEYFCTRVYLKNIYALHINGRKTVI